MVWSIPEKGPESQGREKWPKHNVPILLHVLKISAWNSAAISSIITESPQVRSGTFRFLNRIHCVCSCVCMNICVCMFADMCTQVWREAGGQPQVSYTPFLKQGWETILWAWVKGEKSEKLWHRDIQWLRAHTAFLKDTDLILSTHVVVDSCLQI